MWRGVGVKNLIILVLLLKKTTYLCCDSCCSLSKIKTLKNTYFFKRTSSCSEQKKKKKKKKLKLPAEQNHTHFPRNTFPACNISRSAFQQGSNHWPESRLEFRRTGYSIVDVNCILASANRRIATISYCIWLWFFRAKGTDQLKPPFPRNRLERFRSLSRAPQLDHVTSDWLRVPFHLPFHLYFTLPLRVLVAIFR